MIVFFNFFYIYIKIKNNGRANCYITGNSFAKQEGISLVSQVTSYFKSISGQANTAFGTVILDKKGG